MISIATLLCTSRDHNSFSRRHRKFGVDSHFQITLVAFNPMSLVVNLECVFYKVLGLSLYTELEYVS